MGFTEVQSIAALKLANDNVERATELLLSGADLTGTGGTGGAAGDDDEGWDDDDEEDIEDDEELSDDEGEDEELSPEDDERGRLAMGLMALGNPRDLSRRFIANPTEVLADLQQNQPELFNLIGRHNQFFLDLVNEGANITDEEMEEMEGMEEEEDFSDDSEAMDDATEMFLAAARRGGRGRGGRGGAVLSGGPSASGGAPPPRPLTDDDNAKIEQLMQLGFTREQCTAAYLRCGRNPERAANMLFENPPDV